MAERSAFRERVGQVAILRAKRSMMTSRLYLMAPFCPHATNYRGFFLDVCSLCLYRVSSFFPSTYNTHTRLLSAHATRLLSSSTLSLELFRLLQLSPPCKTRYQSEIQNPSLNAVCGSQRGVCELVHSSSLRNQHCLPFLRWTTVFLYLLLYSLLFFLQ